jgi:hypothetical protein
MTWHQRYLVVQGYTKMLQSQLAVALDSEVWAACHVPSSVQAFVDSLMSAGTVFKALSVSSIATLPTSPVALPKCSAANGKDGVQPPISQQIEAGEKGKTATVAREQETVGEARDAQCLRFPGGTCFIVNSFALLLQQLEAILAFGSLPCQLRLNLGRPVADLLLSANAHAMRQVLGAGAMATAGLRSISARQMAICSQCLLLLEVLMPRLRHRALQTSLPVAMASLATTLDSVSEVCCLLCTLKYTAQSAVGCVHTPWLGLATAGCGSLHTGCVKVMLLSLYVPLDSGARFPLLSQKARKRL